MPKQVGAFIVKTKSGSWNSTDPDQALTALVVGLYRVQKRDVKSIFLLRMQKSSKRHQLAWTFSVQIASRYTTSSAQYAKQLQVPFIILANMCLNKCREYYELWTVCRSLRRYSAQSRMKSRSFMVDLESIRIRRRCFSELFYHSAYRGKQNVYNIRLHMLCMQNTGRPIRLAVSGWLNHYLSLWQK